jgi:hypothetical protein
MYDDYKDLMYELRLTASERPLTPREQTLLDRCERLYNRTRK